MAELDAQIAEGVQVQRSWNINPGQHVPIVLELPDRDGELRREIHTARWGLLKSWNEEENESFKYKTHNAKQETAHTLRTWKDPLNSQRCVVPAEAYYEWEKITAKNRVPHVIRPADGSQILFAGLWEQWIRPADRVTMLTCSILTGDAPPEGSEGVLDDLHRIHHRLPLPLNSHTAREWISPVELDPGKARELLNRVNTEAFEAASSWEVYQVSRDVSNADNDWPELLDRVETETLF